jgi:hypothetical protein
MLHGMLLIIMMVSSVPISVIGQEACPQAFCYTNIVCDCNIRQGADWCISCMEDASREDFVRRNQCNKSNSACASACARTSTGSSSLARCLNACGLQASRCTCNSVAQRCSVMESCKWLCEAGSLKCKFALLLKATCASSQTITEANALLPTTAMTLACASIGILGSLARTPQIALFGLVCALELTTPSIELQLIDSISHACKAYSGIDAYEREQCRTTTQRSKIVTRKVTDSGAKKAKRQSRCQFFRNYVDMLPCDGYKSLEAGCADLKAMGTQWPQDDNTATNSSATLNSGEYGFPDLYKSYCDRSDFRSRIMEICLDRDALKQSCQD